MSETGEQEQTRRLVGSSAFAKGSSSRLHGGEMVCPAICAEARIDAMLEPLCLSGKLTTLARLPVLPTTKSRGHALYCTSSSLSSRDPACEANFSKAAGRGLRSWLHRSSPPELLRAESHSGEFCVQMTAACACDWTPSSCNPQLGSKWREKAAN